MTELIILVATVTIVWIIALNFAIADGRIGRQLKTHDASSDNSMKSDIMRFSIVIPAHEQLEDLQQHLPAFLNQDYEGFEVIVVDMASTDGTRDFLEQMEILHHNLRHTAVPATARDISLDRLALTLGIRAAKYEWVVMTHANCEPLSPQWLSHLAATVCNRKENTDIILGYSHYATKAVSWTDYCEDFHRLWHTIGTVNHVMSGHSAVRADGSNVVIRRESFLEGGGFVAGQTLRMGAAELLVNSLSTNTNTALVLNNDAAMSVERPDGSAWRQMRLSYEATRREQEHSTLYHVMQAWRMSQPWMVLLFIVLPLVAYIAILANGLNSPWIIDRMDSFDAQYGASASQYALIAMAFYTTQLMLAYYTARLLHFNRTAKALGLHPFYSTLICCDLLLPLWQLAITIEYMFMPRSTFRKKFI